MIRLMLDHLRRWSPVLVLAGLLEFGLGWFIALSPKSNFEFWAFLLALWVGGTLLTFDLQRGLLRPVAALPLTGKQIGRSWWFSTVPIPAIGLVTLLFLGAETYCRLHSNQFLPVHRLVMASLFTSVWLGISFNLGFNAVRGLSGGFLEMAERFVVSGLSMMAVFGSMLFGQDASKSSVKSAVLLGVGAVLTIVGWIHAQRFDPGRAGQFSRGRAEAARSRAGFQLTPLEDKTPEYAQQAPTGYGAIGFLLSTTFVRAFSYILVMFALLVLVMCLQGQAISQSLNLSMLASMGSFMACWFVTFYQCIPVLRHLRFLRTLPYSTSNLSAALIAVPVLPLTALGALAAVIAGLVWGPQAAITVLSSFTLMLGAAALCIFVAVWPGGGMNAYALMLFIIFGFHVGRLWLQTRFQYPELPLRFAAIIAGISILMSFLLTRLALLQSSRSYREWPNVLSSLGLGN